MLAILRRAAATWPARILFLVLVVAFASWGAGNVLTNVGSQDPNVAASVGGQKVSVAELTLAYNQQLSRVTQMLGNGTAGVPVQLRRAIAQQAVQRLVVQAALTVEAGRLGLRATDQALRAATFAIPAFHGRDGRFDRATFESVLQANGLTEDRFLALMRRDIAQRELVDPVRAGFAAPALLARRVFDYEAERRQADIVSLPLAAVPPAAAASEAVLHRYYVDHPARYTSPEYRRVRIIVLSADTIAANLPVDEATLHRAFDAERAQFDKPEQRALRVLTTADRAAAEKLAAAWRGGADWAAMQAAAAKAGATAVALPAGTADELPDPTLARAAFAAAPNSATGPVQGASGAWQVLEVTGVVPPVVKSFAEMRDTLRQQTLRAKAQDLLSDRAAKLQDALAGGASFDALPGDLGVAAVAGTLDAKGNTPDGTPAPIPGPAALRTAVVEHAFRMQPGQTSALIDGPDQTYYAVQLEGVTKAGPKPYTDIAVQVLADWRAAQARRVQETRAARIMTAVNAGRTLAAAAAGLPVQSLPPASRSGSTPGVAPQLIQPLFALSPGHATMVETPDGFLVAQLHSVQRPDPASDPGGYAQIRTGLDAAMGNDAEVIFASALRNQLRPRINEAAVAAVVQP